MFPYQLASILNQTVAHFNGLGLPSQWYVIVAFQGFDPVNDGSPTDIYCLEADLGPAPGKPDYNSYAVAQVFSPKYPSMALIFMIERRRSDGEPSGDLAVFGVDVDEKFS